MTATNPTPTQQETLDTELWRDISGVVYSHCKDVQLPRGTNGLIDDLAALLNARRAAVTAQRRASTATIAYEIAQRYYPDDDELADAIRRALDAERASSGKSLLSSEVAWKIALHIKGNNSAYYSTQVGLAELESIISSHFANAATASPAPAESDEANQTRN